MRPLARCAVVATALASALASPATADLTGPAAGAVARGINFLRGQASQSRPGEAALAALALSKAEVPPNDPAIQAYLRTVLGRFGPQGYVPEREGGHDLYEAAVTCLALANIDPINFKPQVEAAANYILSRQKANGSWDYVARTAGDCSITQYALLGLWEAESIGIEVPARVWDTAALWYMSKQYPSGGWNYHPDETQTRETVAMTAAGAGSLLLCRAQLDRLRKGPEILNPLLTPLVVEGSPNANYKIVATSAAMNASARRGVEWLKRNYNPAENDLIGLTAYYGLYGVERVAALAEKQPEIIGSWDWYGRGVTWTLSQQKADGSWDSRQYGPVVNTAWAILFATKATQNSARKIEIRRLGAGTLLGGRGLPADLNNMTIAQGRVVVRPMSGAIEGMLAVLEDPAATNADAALAGLITRYQAGGPDALRPYKDRFRKLLRDRDPGVRRVACWALGRTGDLDVAPNLIRALRDPDDSVVAEARVGLQVLSRKIDGLGPPRGADAEQKLEAARRWRDWYEASRPPNLPPIDDPALNRPVAAPTQASASATGSATTTEAPR